MNGRQYHELVQLIKNEARDAFRSAWKYDEDDWVALYVRNDIATEELHEAISSLIDAARENEPIIQPEVYGKMGDVEAEIELHSEAVLLHFPEAASEGVIVTLDQEAARDLTGFIERCNTVLNEP